MKQNSEYVAHCIDQNVTLHTAIPNTQQVEIQYTLTINKRNKTVSTLHTALIKM